MTPAIRKPKLKPSLRCTVVVLDEGWTEALPNAERLARRAARAAFAGARRSGRRSLNVALDDDKGVRALNARDRKKDKPTNVLSYPSGERDFLGDMVLARQTVWREAREQRKSAADHFTHLVVHGTLHLLGYDHETGEADAERMEALERRILAKLGIADPYALDWQTVEKVRSRADKRNNRNK
jgi:probable rRNA maturation factor